MRRPLDGRRASWSRPLSVSSVLVFLFLLSPFLLLSHFSVSGSKVSSYINTYLPLPLITPTLSHTPFVSCSPRPSLGPHSHPFTIITTPRDLIPRACLFPSWPSSFLVVVGV